VAVKVLDSVESSTEAFENVTLSLPGIINTSTFTIKRTIGLKYNYIAADLAFIFKEPKCVLLALFKSEPQMVNVRLELGRCLPASEGISRNVKKISVIAVCLRALG